MRPRDAAILGALVLIAGFAAADAFRASGSPDRERTATTAIETATATGERVDTGPDRFTPVPAGGAVVFTDRADCRVRFALARTGAEAAFPLLGRSCELWAAPRGALIAYGLGRASRDGDAVPFRFADLREPVRTFGGSHALFGFIAWSPDGRRAAWCGRSRAGFDIDVVRGRARRLPRCPAAYTPAGRIVYAVGNTLVREDGRVVLRAPNGITFVRWARDGSLVVGLDGSRLARYDARGHRAGIFDVPDGRIPVLSPDNCAAAFTQEDGKVRVVALGCFGGRTLDVVGTDVAWSPDGKWVVVAAPDALVFHRLAGVPETVRWPAEAAEVAWR